MKCVTSLSLWLSLAVGTVAQDASYSCPTAGGETAFVVEESKTVSLTKTPKGRFLCNLVREEENGKTLPVARSYNARAWEASGSSSTGTFLTDWECQPDSCSTSLPPGRYILQLRNTPWVTMRDNRARFLESTSFGATPSELASFSDSFQEWVKAQSQEAPTYHREFFRRNMNPMWRFHKFEFPAALDPCAKLSTWRRNAIASKDHNKDMVVTKHNDHWWEVRIDGHLRTMSQTLAFESPYFTLQEGTYRLCSNHRHLNRGIVRVKVKNSKGTVVCQPLEAESLLIDFPQEFKPPGVLGDKVEQLSDTTVWKPTSYLLPEFLRLVDSQPGQCDEIPSDYSGLGIPVFFLTDANEWLVHDPRITMADNTKEAPELDGGLANFEANKTSACTNVPRSIFNEGNCVLASQEACLPGESTKAIRPVVCGSEGEVSNDPMLGDSLLDMAAIDTNRKNKFGLPSDTNGGRSSRQREFVWSQIVSTSKDQFRQRAAWALSQIFAMPKSSIGSEARLTEPFLHYYDIFVRHALGNYRDILMETTFHPLMGESLSYINSRSVADTFRRTSTKQFPDENFAREVMQLFTIGLVELQADGTPKLDSDGNVVQTYDSQDIINFARVWTGFVRQPRRANIETLSGPNKLDPMSIVPLFRDRFPKSNLDGGFIGDKFPLCSDLPEKGHLRKGAKYRLLGSISRPENVVDDPDWSDSLEAKRLVLESGNSGLFEKLCAKSSTHCTYPGIVTLDEDLVCSGNKDECGDIDLPRIVKVGQVFYEYIRTIPCVNTAFFEGNKVSSARGFGQSFCANPALPVASSACCAPGDKVASSNCAFAGERLAFASAKARCESIGQEVCNYKILNVDNSCPHSGSHWTASPCSIKAKVNTNGEVAIVHETGTGVGIFVRDTTPSFFRVSWSNGDFPNPETCVGQGCTLTDDGSCLCDVDITDKVVFQTPPGSSYEVMSNLQIGFAEPDRLQSSSYTRRKRNGFSFHSKDGKCCDENTVFEATDRNGRTFYLKNVKSIVHINGTKHMEFRNPPQFNSADDYEYSITDALHETEAAIDYLLYHNNTAPFVAYRLIQRFGISNPSPRFVSAVAKAFRKGSYKRTGTEFGKGQYGDLEATMAAIVLDPDMMHVPLDADPFSGSLREPVLKVISFMRAMEFKSTIPMIELDLMNEKVGQMAHEQPSVFSFFRPEYSPPGIASNSSLVAPEAEVMSSRKVINLIQGLWSMMDVGMRSCDQGFGYADCYAETNSGQLQNTFTDAVDLKAAVKEASTLLTAGRLSKRKQDMIIEAASAEPDKEKAAKIAVKMITTTPEFHTTNVEDPLSKGTSDPQFGSSNTAKGNYKAVIHLALRGGCDSFQVLTPHPSCTESYSEYKSVRGSIAMKERNLLRVDASGQTCESYGLHHELPFLKEMYDDGHLAFLANTGVLTQPVSKDDFETKTETRLFAHNAMQDEVDKLDPWNKAVGTGTLGRMADVLESRGFRTARTAVATLSTNLAGVSSTTPPVYTLDEDGVFPLDMGDLGITGGRELVEALNGKANNTGKSGTFGEVWSTVLDRSLNQTEQIYYLLQANSETTTTFGTESLDKRVKLISQLIQGRADRGVDRDMFFLTIGGFDHHSGVDEPLAERLATVNDSIENLVSELKHLEVWDDVVIVQTSDFGRTLVPNSGGGSDHGWGGNYWMAGGKVNGGQILGDYPSLSLDSDVCIDDVRGRLMPTMPWESPFQAVANWMGIDHDETSDLDVILPNRNKFPGLLHGSDVFNT